MPVLFPELAVLVLAFALPADEVWIHDQAAVSLPEAGLLLGLALANELCPPSRRLLHAALLTDPRVLRALFPELL